ncbi:MAG: acetyl-CoA C-acyltransferase [Devosiaceae bacterium]|nr:acetyl-CoA C-acyltransferase [Devosiaceae bacterium]
MSDPIVIVGMGRMPIGAFQGAFNQVSAAQLGGSAIAAALKDSKIEANQIDELLMGCVLPAGQGQAPARQAGFAAGLSKNTPAVTINKMCGSGMKTVMMAHDQLLANNGSILIAGGMESMSNAPYLLPKMRNGARMGHAQALDHMFFDGLEDAYEKGRLMGAFAEDCATKYALSRKEQDDFALTSLARAKQAQKSGAFEKEITPFTVKTRKGEIIISEDESPSLARPEKIPHLKAAFKDGGTITAANASSISDGAAALVLMRQSDAKAQGLKIHARILGHASHAHEPNWFATAPVPAMQKLMKSTGLKVADVDLWEVNEAFAVVPMAAMAEIGMDHNVLNIYGGACALGHPIGASGARILVTLLNALKQNDKIIGIASLCIGGGEGTAMAIEMAG